MKQREKMATNMGVMNKYMNWMAIAVLAFWFTPAGAQDPAKIPGEMDAMPGMDHGKMENDTSHKKPVIKRRKNGMKHGNMAPSNASMETMPGMGDGQVNGDNAPQKSNTNNKGVMDHDSMHGQSASTDNASMDTMSDMDHGQMDHGNMSSKDTGTLREEGGMSHGVMHGGSAPSDARDPHAYSGGYTLDPARPLKLADEHNFGSLRVDRLESIRTRDSSSTAYSLQGWFGRNYDRAVIKAEGDIDNGKLQEAQTDLLWSHAIATYWDTQLGIRYDSGTGPNRGWLALGVQGLAPYWFDVNITTYIGDEGRSALQLEADYELLLTQKLVFQPRVEANLYGKRDIERGLGSGLSDTSLGLRLRYEIRREIAPYAGIEWSKKFGGTADYARDTGQEAAEMRVVTGIRFWF